MIGCITLLAVSGTSIHRTQAGRRGSRVGTQLAGPSPCSLTVQLRRRRDAHRRHCNLHWHRRFGPLVQPVVQLASGQPGPGGPGLTPPPPVRPPRAAGSAARLGQSGSGGPGLTLPSPARPPRAAGGAARTWPV